jgi:hypothetical protein
MDQGPLVTQQIDAGSRFIHEFAKQIPIQAAFWLRTSEDNEWFLYVVSDQINDSSVRLAYGEVSRITSKLADPWLDSVHVKVIGTNKPVAKAILDIQGKYPGRLPARYRDLQLGGIFVEEAYVYPPPAAVPN